MAAPRHPAPFGARWRGSWIWFERPRITTASATRPILEHPEDRVGLFRRDLELETVPLRAPCRIWVDGRYLLTVNGIEAGRGPVRSDPRRAHYDVIDLAQLLTVGANTIGITARHFGEDTSWWTPVPPTYSLGAGSLTFELQIDDQWVVADRTWRATAANAWTPVPLPRDVACLPLESFDARRHPHGWNAPGFDDGSWRRAIEIAPVHTGGRSEHRPPSEPFGMLLPPVRQSFPGGLRHEVGALAWTRGPSSALVDDPVRQVLADEISSGNTDLLRASVDLGSIVAGTVQLCIDGACAGTIVDVAAAEHLDEDGRLVPLGQHAGFRYICDDRSSQVFETFDVIGTRYLSFSVRTVGPTPTISLVVHDRHRARPPGATFACSDPLLEQIHAVGLRTVDLCALDAYIDCPSREQRAWTGDSVVHQMVDLVSNPDWSMAIWHPQLAAAPRADGMLAMAPASDFWAADGTMVPDWSLHWVRSVHNLWRYTGDLELVGELLPVVERVLRWFETYLGDDGLLRDVTGWVLLDWASVYSDGQSSTLNALWARALEDLTEMADALGNAGTAHWSRRRRQGVLEGFEAFWDEHRGVYVDCIVEAQPSVAAAQHGGAAALAAGLVPATRIERVIERLLDRSRLLRHSFVMDSVTVGGDSSGFLHLVNGYPPPSWDPHEQMVAAEPFFRYVLHDGLARAGRADLIVDQVRDWAIFLEAGESTWPECWNGGTRCHGWSSTPTRDLIVHTLGIQPAAPGYAAVRVTPALGDLQWASASVPTPHGTITVTAHADGRLEIDSPVPVV